MSNTQVELKVKHLIYTDLWTEYFFNNEDYLVEYTRDFIKDELPPNRLDTFNKLDRDSKLTASVELFNNLFLDEYEVEFFKEVYLNNDVIGEVTVTKYDMETNEELNQAHYTSIREALVYLLGVIKDYYGFKFYVSEQGLLIFEVLKEVDSYYYIINKHNETQRKIDWIK